MIYMRLSEFYYELPKHLIAQKPITPRDSSKLMVISDKKIHHRTFRDLTEYLDPGDVLVVNDSKVLPARIFGKKETGGKVEALLITKEGENTWECLIKGKNIKEKSRLVFGEGALSASVKERIQGGRYKLEFQPSKNFGELLQKIGIMPTPPYIKEVLKDPNRYQTVYANNKGSIAAPTAGLHFTEDLLKELESKGVVIVKLTLHVSVGTFLPVKQKYIEEHKMESEYFQIEAKSADLINNAKKNNKRIIAVGTTSLKALESACDDKKVISEFAGQSDLFIYPGYNFKFPYSGLLTNFHLPQSTLLMLVCAFAGKDTIFEAYSEAIANSYRFYSFGDAMLILK
jgi:S-adenosylmethionine:tRNA ribosyltransferase-isomerase